ncbi:hypothetical protein ACFLRR_00040 [Bacteroidota bacterium]
MKKYLWIFISVLFLTGCSSSKKLLQNQNYDLAINKSVKKLVKDPSDKDEINILKQAYRLANTRDNDRLKYLKLSDEPDIWDETFVLYEKLKSRQQEVERLLPELLSKINFKKLDFDKDILSAKKNAAEYYYSQGISLLDKNQKISAREAYNVFYKVKSYYPNYKDVDEKIKEAHFIGTSQVLFSIRNRTEVVLPKEFENELLSFSLSGLDSKWLNYDLKKQKDIFYDYNVFLNIKTIDVSPERLSENIYEDKQSVKDGWRYSLDANGNVKKDSLGNDIKTPKYKIVKCTVNQTTMTKRAMVSGSLEFYNNITKEMIKKVPIATESSFEHIYARYEGNKIALSDKSKKLLRNKPIPFPSDIDMIWQTQENLKNITKQKLKLHKRLLEK